ncbi:MAG: hypothetical protein PHV37_01605 [Candidatus Gastranaerophilales bacterium]|nr:hypothetical protein [Candidatus Gastranaerophilales bacterium]
MLKNISKFIICIAFILGSCSYANSTISYGKYYNTNLNGGANSVPQIGSVIRDGQTINHYDTYGQKNASFKKYPDGTVKIYDKRGELKGSFKQSLDGTITEYDEYGRKIGSFK